MKLAIIGRGTVGCISAAFFLRNTDWEIEWYFDPDIKPLSVGEGSFVGFADLLYKIVDFTYDSLKKVDGTIKTGVNKVGWGDKNFINNFPPPCIGYHFDAVKLQDYITTYLKDNRRIKFINKNVTHDDIDADFIMDCSGKPKNLEDYNTSEFIPVNSAYVTQCYWDYPKFSETLSIARPYGWIFGVPLGSRCAIGYVYNNKINNIDEIKDDVKNIFNEYELTPSEKTNSLNFNNYNRKINFTDRVIYNGANSNFLEPLETTPLWQSYKVLNYSLDQWLHGKNKEDINNLFLKNLDENETLLMLHYYSNSTYNNDFWNLARNNAEKKIKLLDDESFFDLLHCSKPNCLPIDIQFGVWNFEPLKNNLQNLNLYSKLLKLR